MLISFVERISVEGRCSISPAILRITLIGKRRVTGSPAICLSSLLYPKFRFKVSNGCPHFPVCRLVIAQFERELVLVDEVKKFVGNLNIVGFLMDAQNVKQKIG